MTPHLYCLTDAYVCTVSAGGGGGELVRQDRLTINVKAMNINS